MGLFLATQVERNVKVSLLGYLRRAFSHNSPAVEPEASPLSEFARIREDRRAALAAFAVMVERGDTRGQRSTQLKAIQATNAALRVGQA